MKNLKSLNLGKSLNRAEMKSISAGLQNMPSCSCSAGTAGTLTFCGCQDFCNSVPGC
ncbi:hypothetical protein [Flavobacterium sp.]|uniref:hypothetical protein n=1 Tax=Flavobacterium sp. TaxID=239 RepID=UPI00374DE945